MDTRKSLKLDLVSLSVFALLALVVLFPQAAYASLQPAAGDLESAAVSPQADELTVQASDTFTHKGIDVSQWQGSINWSAVARTDVKFAIIRCGYGSDYSSQDDRYWLQNVKGARAAGIPIGVYIYSYTTSTAGARSEAQHVLRCLRNAGLSGADLAFPIYYDIEEQSQKSAGPDTMKAVFDEFRSVLNANGYSKVGCYTSASWLAGGAALSTVSLDADYWWIASWSVSNPYEGRYGNDVAFRRCGVWQYGGSSVSGISGEVDSNYARSDLRFLEQTGNTRRLYRLYNPNSGEHFYTQSSAECGFLEGVGWRYEGVGWTEPASTGVPVYRVYNPNAGDHHYTVSVDEYNHLGDVGWNKEGISFYSTDSEKVKTYRLYNPNARSGAHHYTTDSSEKDHLVSLGWNYEGICWYCLS